MVVKVFLFIFLFERLKLLLELKIRFNDFDSVNKGSSFFLVILFVELVY